MIIKYTDHIPIGNYKDTTVFYDEETGVLLHGRQVGYKEGCGKSLLSTGGILLATVFLRVLGEQLNFTRDFGTLLTTYVVALLIGLVAVFFS